MVFIMKYLVFFVALVLSNANVTEDHVKKVCHDVKIRDDLLTKYFEELNFDDRDKVFPALQNYAEAMEDLLECYQQNDKMTADLCKDVIDEGAPKFMNLHYDLEVIQAKFNWTEDDTEDLYSLRKKCLDVWCDLDDLLPPSTHVEMTSRTTWF